MSDDREAIAETLWQAEKDANQSGAPGYGETWQDEPVRHLYRAQAAAVERIVAARVAAARADERSRIAVVEDMAERAERKGYDLDPYDVLAALAPPAATERERLLADADRYAEEGDQPNAAAARKAATLPRPHAPDLTDLDAAWQEATTRDTTTRCDCPSWACIEPGSAGCYFGEAAR